jgi:hypothetical protein
MIAKGSLNGYEPRGTFVEYTTLVDGVGMVIQLIASMIPSQVIRPLEGIEYLAPLGEGTILVKDKLYDKRHLIRVAPGFGVAISGETESNPRLYLRFAENFGVTAVHFRGATFQGATNVRTRRNSGMCGSEYYVEAPTYQYWLAGNQPAEHLKDPFEVDENLSEIDREGRGKSRFILVTEAGGSITLHTLDPKQPESQEIISLIPGDWVVVPPCTNYHIKVQHTGECITCLFI